MKDIFLSYAREDKAAAKRLQKALTQRGWSLFWDYQIKPGEDFPEKIQSEAESAGCVVVLWSKKSVDSDWVVREARIGASRKRLLPARIEDVALPRGFRNLHTVELAGWTGLPSHPGFKDLLNGVVGLLGGEPRKRKAFQMALRNIAQRGDTDVLPYPIEKQIFLSKESEALELLQRMDAKFDDFVGDFKPYYEASLYPAGFYGYRWVTQIDPIWNAYLLGLVVAIAGKIESARVPLDQSVVFSYRFDPVAESAALFNLDIGWTQYQKQSLLLAEKYEHVVVCDIADFYPRVSHDHVKQAMEAAKVEPATVDRICRLLRVLSGGDPYGLPVGGPAARLLSELVLHAVDELLLLEDIAFCRFADDYHLFARDKEEAYRHLMLTSELLFSRLGLMLRKTKTRVMSAAEFKATTQFALRIETESGDGDRERKDGAGLWGLLNLKIPFDPYSADPVGDYERLRREINKHNLLEILTKELAKSRPDPALTRRVIDAIRYLDLPRRAIAVEGLIDSSRLERLYPLLSNVLRTLRYLVETPEDEGGLDEATSVKVFDTLGGLIRTQSYLIRIPAYLGYAIRVVLHDGRRSADRLLVAAYRSAPSMVRRDIILAMAIRGNGEWIKRLLKQEKDLSPWERRALIIASYRLGGAGVAWRRSLEGETLSPADRLTLEWAEENSQSEEWSIPL